jgi:hypothetical protein
MPVSYWIFKNSPEEVVTLSLDAKKRSRADAYRLRSAVSNVLLFYVRRAQISRACEIRKTAT